MSEADHPCPEPGVEGSRARRTDQSPTHRPRIRSTCRPGSGARRVRRDSGHELRSPGGSSAVRSENCSGAELATR
jgi:hypothetical protein